MPRARGPDRQAWQSSSDARTHGGASPVPLLLLATPSLVLHRGTPARDSSRTAWRQSKHVSLAGTAQHGAETSGVGRLGRRATGARVCARHGREGRYPTCAGASGTCRAVPRRCASPRRAIAAGAARGRAPAPRRSRKPRGGGKRLRRRGAGWGEAEGTDECVAGAAGGGCTGTRAWAEGRRREEDGGEKGDGACGAGGV